MSKKTEMSRTNCPADAFDHSVKASLSLAFLIHDVSRLCEIAFNRRLERLHITRAQLSVLVKISQYQESCYMQGQLCRLLGLSKGSLNNAIDHLCDAGLVERFSERSDLRRRRVRISIRGTSLLEDFEMACIEVRDRLMKDISIRDEDLMIDLLSRMNITLKTMRLSGTPS